jgi:hypothetical protein
MPTLATLNAPYFAKWDTMRDVLARGWNRRGHGRQTLLAALAHSLHLSKWESLVRQQELRVPDAIDLLVAMVRSA